MQTNAFTPVGNTIRNILQENDSIHALIKYFTENRIFSEYTATCRKDRALYAYQINQDEWENITGIPIENTDFLPNTKDGVIFVDRYYDSEFRDYNGNTRYVYICLDTTVKESIQETTAECPMSILQCCKT